jgi:hypothetical protein
MLWLNLDRAQSRRAWEVKRGIELALGRAPVPADVLGAVTRSDAEAENLTYETHKQQAWAALLTR